MTEKEKKFCLYYANTRNVREAAARAGYGVLSELTGMRLLAKSEIRDYIDKIEKSLPQENLARAGLERLAFGSISDAVKLIFCDTEKLDPDALDAMELYCVSEIKRPKGGGLEIKFFDRLKALEKLLGISDEQYDDTVPFYKAVLEGAKNLYSRQAEKQDGI
ncbi:MAG: terminase small subunit [Clostridia bacterium]|nr:terminase small subunit [Clostridia bacterium]